MSTLDVVAEILREAAPQVLSTQEIAERALLQAWRTTAKVPARAISRALSADLCGYGETSRFLKIARDKHTVKEVVPVAVHKNTAVLNQQVLGRCSRCGLLKARSDFSKAGWKHTLREICKVCRNADARDWNTARRTSTKSRSSKLLAAARKRAKDRNLPFDLDHDWLLVRLERGMCEATGLSFDLAASREWNTPSLDRIDSALGYTKANTRLVLFAVNAACGNWGEARLLQITAILAARSAHTSSIEGAL